MFRSHLNLRWLTLGSIAVVLVYSVVASADDLTFVDVRDLVAKNEKLYESIEFHSLFEYSAGPQSGYGINMKTIKSKSSKRHHVSSGKMYRIDEKYSAVFKNSEETYAYRRIKMYDGLQTKMLKDPEYANLFKGYSGDKNSIYPHMVLMRGPYHSMRLSTLLSGEETLSTASDVTCDDDLSIRYSLDSENSEHAGISCVELSIFLSKKTTPLVIHKLWLAKNRNYIPCKYESLYLKISKETPIETGTVQTWVEVEKGVWFPKTASVIALNPFLLTSTGEKKIQWSKNYRFDGISLAPDYPQTYFQDLEIPEGLPVYEIDKGEIVKSWRSPGP